MGDGRARGRRVFGFYFERGGICVSEDGQQNFWASSKLSESDSEHDVKEVSLMETTTLMRKGMRRSRSDQQPNGP
ncbi:hypothetical protein Taro_031727 [Colocasia esculenta]|uniref:Uncharacterized protein n=1 Tax=Colocasia esculenta TaxID=4460 RepID=A0A843VXD8_COLES|nr:hypothetical protein [Colocasia esculenta]